MLTTSPEWAHPLGLHSGPEDLFSNGALECSLLRGEIPVAAESAGPTPGAEMFANRLRKNRRIKVEREWVDIDLPVKYYDLSAHAGKSGLMEFIDAASPQKVICMHGDCCVEFAGELKEKGYDAYAPKRGETVKL